MKQMVFLRFDAAEFNVDSTAPRDPSRTGLLRGSEKVEKLRDRKMGITYTT